MTTMARASGRFEVVHGATRRPPEVSTAGQRLAAEAASRVAARTNVPRIDKTALAAWRAEADRRSLYVLGVRTPEEYEVWMISRGRVRHPAASWCRKPTCLSRPGAPASFLWTTVQACAAMTASWLKQMGWDDVAVLTAAPADGDWVSGPYRPRRWPRPRHHDRATGAARAAGRHRRGGHRSRYQPALRPGPYPGRLVCDALVPRRRPGEAPQSRDDRADLAR